MSLESPGVDIWAMGCLSPEDLVGLRGREVSQDCPETRGKKANLERVSQVRLAPWDSQESQELRAHADPQVYLAPLEFQEKRAPLVDRASRVLQDPRVNQLPYQLSETWALCSRTPAACARRGSLGFLGRRERRGPPEHEEQKA